MMLTGVQSSSLALVVWLYVLNEQLGAFMSYSVSAQRQGTVTFLETDRRRKATYRHR